jgi:hypothetical protein
MSRLDQSESNYVFPFPKEISPVQPRKKDFILLLLKEGIFVYFLIN